MQKYRVKTIEEVILEGGFYYEDKSGNITLLYDDEGKIKTEEDYIEYLESFSDEFKFRTIWTILFDNEIPAYRVIENSIVTMPDCVDDFVEIKEIDVAFLIGVTLEEIEEG